MFHRKNTPAKLFAALTLVGMTLLGTTACGSRTAPMTQFANAPQMTAMRAPLQAQGAQSFGFSRFNSNVAGEPSGYYAGAQGQTGQGMIDALNQIVARHQDLGYSQGRDVMFSVVDDLDNDDVVEGVYTGRRLDKVNDRTSAYRDGSGLNAEHTWPKSKGAGGGPAKSDLHHLFPSDINANSARSSYPFGVVTRVDKSFAGSKLGTDAQGRTVFEPRDEHKGNVARALFYFYTVYGRNGISTSNFRVEEPVLLQWHKMDPVDAAERARNQAVFQAQGNRNPYIDHPEFVDAVGRFLN